MLPAAVKSLVYLVLLMKINVFKVTIDISNLHPQIFLGVQQLQILILTI